jgi:hypothetical protein
VHAVRSRSAHIGTVVTKFLPNKASSGNHSQPRIKNGPVSLKIGETTSAWKRASTAAKLNQTARKHHRTARHALPRQRVPERAISIQERAPSKAATPYSTPLILRTPHKIRLPELKRAATSSRPRRGPPWSLHRASRKAEDVDFRPGHGLVMPTSLKYCATWATVGIR